jgi:hypothetical protein
MDGFVAVSAVHSRCHGKELKNDAAGARRTAPPVPPRGEQWRVSLERNPDPAHDLPAVGGDSMPRELRRKQLDQDGGIAVIGWPHFDHPSQSFPLAGNAPSRIRTGPCAVTVVPAPSEQAGVMFLPGCP